MSKNKQPGEPLRTIFKPRFLALAVAATLSGLAPLQLAMAGPGKVTDVSGTEFQTFYANSPLLRKFVDTLPGLTPAGANTFASGAVGEYIPLGVPDTTSYANSDYYLIGVVEHEQRMHSDLQKATRLRSYVQIYPDTTSGSSLPPSGSFPLKYPDGAAITWPQTGNQVYGYDKPHYLGPIIVANSGRAVRVKMVNFLPPGSPHFLPVDESLGGAGMAVGADKYSQSRAAFHLHGGDNPWISDGTPHQWVTAVGDPSPYKKGERLTNVPDMPDPGDGATTLYWPNNQSARLMWYHDHTFGLTRQNAYAGEAAGYLIVDAAELALLNGGTVNGVSVNKAIPGGLLDQIPLVIQDKAFVPDDIAIQDAKWDTTVWGNKGDLWFPHVYEPNQIWDPASGNLVQNNPAGRWDYAIDPNSGQYVPPKFPLPDGSPGNVSTTPEAYMDTPVINGVAYPVLNVQPKAYRVRFLNGANDRYFNLSIWVADNTVVSNDGRTNTEVRMIDRQGTPGGIPAPETAGPSIIQFANEAGFLPKPVVHKPVPASYDTDGVMTGGGLFLGNAERADTVIDFSQYAGKTLIIYNDSAAPVPAGDQRYDYFTGNPDLTSSGGAPSTLPGFGPNTRTLMQIRVAPGINGGTAAAAPYDPAGVGGPLVNELPKVYAATVDPRIVPVGIPSNIDLAANTLTLANGSVVPLKVKTIEGFNEPNYGRLIAQIGAELPGQVGSTPLNYIDTPTDIIGANEQQYWLIKNNDGDNHPMHFHLFNVQVVARITQTVPATIKAPEADEAGWKETVKNWPGEDLIVAVKPKTPQVPFGLPNSVRLLDPTLPANTVTNTALFPLGAPPDVPYAFTQLNLTTGAPTLVKNILTDYGWEYVWHCHILGHEENDLMRPLVFRPVITAPAAPTGVSVSTTGTVSWIDPTPAGVASTIGNPAGEIGFRVERAIVTNGQLGPFIPLDGLGVPNNEASGVNQKAGIGTLSTLANATTYQDTPPTGTDLAYRVVAVNPMGQGVSAQVNLLQAPIAAPGNLTSTLSGTNTVGLTWSDNAFGETGYVVKRATGTINISTGAITWGAFASLPTATSTLAKNLTSYTDVAKANTLYQYQVYAVRGTIAGASASTIAATATTLVAPTKLQPTGSPTVSTVAIQWQATTAALASATEVQRCVGNAAVCGAAGAAWTTVGTVAGSNNQKFTDTGLKTKTAYTHRLRAINSLFPSLVSPWTTVLSQTTR